VQLELVQALAQGEGVLPRRPAVQAVEFADNLAVDQQTIPVARG